MSFLNTWILLALPLIGLPVLIHLMNQRRHKQIHWGAMHFLRKARRMNTGVAKLRYWFILCVRMLAIAALIFGLSRPMATGWFGRLGAEARTSLIILDRSPSMEFQESAGGLSKRATALQRIDQWFATLQSDAERILITTGLDAPLTLAPDVRLSDLAETGPTAASSHMTGLLEQAIQYLKRHDAGPTDIWICSDRSRLDWDVEDGRWTELRQQLQEFPAVRLMLLSYPDNQATNLAIRIDRVERREVGDKAELLLDIHLRQTSGELAAQRVPGVLEVGGVRTAIEIDLKGREVSLSGVTIPLDAQLASGTGRIEIPGDANPADNSFHFAFAKPTIPNTTVVTDDDEIGSFLELACQTPSSSNLSQRSRRLRSDQLSELDWKNTCTIVWHGPLPSGTIADQLRQFVAEGRSLLFLPPPGDSPTSTRLAMSTSTTSREAEEERFVNTDTLTGAESLWGVTWLDWKGAAVDASWKLQRWRTDGDLLSHTASSSPLPLQDILVHRFCSMRRTAGPIGNGQVLAELQNGEPLLYRAPTDRGGVYFCSTLPNAQSSTLAMDGVALYIMLQRLIQEGAQGLSPAQTLVAGSPALPSFEDWNAANEQSREIPKHDRRWQAGGYQNDGQCVALNRSLQEDELESLNESQLKQLLGDVPYHVVDDRAGAVASLANEVWRLFVVGMIVALLLEARLTLPSFLSNTSSTREQKMPNAGGAR